MIDELEIKQAYLRATDPDHLGPDLQDALSRGRSARRRRTRLRVLGAVVATAAVVVTTGVLGTRVLSEDGRVDTVPPAGAPTDFVAGTTIDETMVEVVQAHLPSLAAPRDVFPSNIEHNGPMPDSDFAQATDWQAEYDVSGGGFLRVMMGLPVGGDVCPDCTATEVAGGRLLTQEFTSRSDLDVSHPWVFLTTFESEAGTYVVVTEKVAGTSLEAARAARTTTDAQLAELAQDPRLTFPAPVS